MGTKEAEQKKTISEHLDPETLRWCAERCEKRGDAHRRRLKENGSVLSLVQLNTCEALSRSFRNHATRAARARKGEGR